MWAFIALISIPNSLTHWRSMFRICLIRLWTNRLCHGFDWTCHFGKACEINTGNKTNTALDCKPDKSAACRWILIKEERNWGKSIFFSVKTCLQANLLLCVFWTFSNNLNGFHSKMFQTLSVEKPPGCPNSIESLKGTVRSELTRATATKIKQRDCCFLVVKRSTICRLYQGRALPLKRKWMIVSPPEIRLLNIV